MIFDIILALLVAGLLVFVWYQHRELEKLKHQVIHIALNVNEVSDRVNRVDDTTGKAIFDLTQKFNEFNKLYGEAAIEEKREAAKAEKAWAEGISNIMSFGARFQGRGDDK